MPTDIFPLCCNAMEMTLLLGIVAAILVLIGVAGLLFSALPGVILIFSALVVAAWGGHFVYVGVLYSLYWSSVPLLPLNSWFMLHLSDGEFPEEKRSFSTSLRQWLHCKNR